MDSDRETPLDALGDRPLPDAVPSAMPEDARSDARAPQPEDYPDATDAEGVPPGTAPEVPPALGTSETMAPVDGVHTPDVGEGAEQFDTDATPLPGRTDYGRS